ncbi:MAG: topoisomerase C-terminal repeat-containing protein, partial [Bacteroidia bacterium]
TAKVEEQFDEIADGNQAWQTMIGDFYGDFAQLVIKTTEEAERADGERELGIDPKSERMVLARLGRYGPMIQIGRNDDDFEEKPKYAKLRVGQLLETITMEEAMELFRLPRTLGEMEEQPVKVNIGRYGPYAQLGRLFASLEEEDDPYEITFERAVELIKKKREADANKIIKSFNEEVQILRGRWGPYLKYKGANVKLPKDIEPENLTLEDCDRLAEESKNKPKRGKPKAKAKAPKAKKKS